MKQKFNFEKIPFTLRNEIKLEASRNNWDRVLRIVVDHDANVHNWCCPSDPSMHSFIIKAIELKLI